MATVIKPDTTATAFVVKDAAKTFEMPRIKEVALVIEKSSPDAVRSSLRVVRIGDGADEEPKTISFQVELGSRDIDREIADASRKYGEENIIVLSDLPVEGEGNMREIAYPPWAEKPACSARYRPI